MQFLKNKHILNRIFLVVFYVLYMTSCSILIPKPKSAPKHTHYSFKINEDHWNKTKKDLSDHAFINSSSGSHIFINSICKKYSKTGVNELATSILSGIKNLKIKSDKNFKLYNREAKEIKGNGLLDGVTFSFKTLTFQRNRCTFDFILLIVGNNIDLNEEKDFDDLTQSLEFKK